MRQGAAYRRGSLKWGLPTPLPLFVTTTATRTRLIEALKALKKARPKVSFRTAFLFLSRFVPGIGPRRDKELAQAFREAAKALDAKQPERK